MKLLRRIVSSIYYKGLVGEALEVEYILFVCFVRYNVSPAVLILAQQVILLPHYKC